jgi:hypothetical protein
LRFVYKKFVINCVNITYIYFDTAGAQSLNTCNFFVRVEAQKRKTAGALLTAAVSNLTNGSRSIEVCVACVAVSVEERRDKKEQGGANTARCAALARGSEAGKQRRGERT